MDTVYPNKRFCLCHGLGLCGRDRDARAAAHRQRRVRSFPKLRIVLGHLGETLPFMLDRIDNRYRFETGLFPDKRMKRRPSEYFRDHFVVTTTGMNFPAPLKAAIAVLGIDNVLFGIDHPYEEQAEEVAKFEAMSFSEADKKKLYQTNSERVFRL